ncbi:MAG: magnesium/cobalt transporter CorA [Chloroflexota bacterium]
MLRTLLRDESNQFRVVDDPTAISDIVRHPNRLLWLDLEQPTAADFVTIQEEFQLHPLAIEDAMTRHQRPKVDQYRNFYLVIFYSVAIDDPAESGTLSGRRGLRGSTFHRATGDIHPPGSNGSHGDKSSPWGNEPFVTRDKPDTTGGKPESQINNGSGESAVNPNERIVLREISLFMGENYLITVHTHEIPELDEAARRWRQNAAMITAEHNAITSVPGTRSLTPQENAFLRTVPTSDGKASGKTPEPLASDAQKEDGIGILLYSLLDTIVDNYFPVIDNIVDRIENLEEQIFENYSQDAVESIFTLKKDLLALRKVLAPERDVLNVLIRRDLPIFEQHTIVYFQDVYDHVIRITDSIDTYRDLLSSALDSFLSMQSNRLNITVQTLTSVSIMLMSVAAITGWYGMNFQNMPELSTRFGYPVVLVVVLLIVVAEWIFFRRKHWL